jgi:hypothetical protein
VKAILGALIPLVTLLITLGIIKPFQGEDPIEKAVGAGSARVDLARTVSNGSTRVVGQAQGAFDFRSESGELRYTDGVVQIFRKPYVYEAFPKPKGVWCRYDLSALGPGFLFGALTGFKNDPAAALSNLRDFGTYKKVGEERVFGIKTKHYSGHIDLGRLLEATTEAQIRPLIRQFSLQNGGELPIDVWVRRDYLVSRLGTSFDVPGAEYGLDGEVHIDATYDFSDFNVRVAVSAPRTSKVADPGKRGCPQVP